MSTRSIGLDEWVTTGERALERLKSEAKKRPVAAAAFAGAEVLATVVVFGMAETLLAATATYVAYTTLSQRSEPKRKGSGESSHNE